MIGLTKAHCALYEAAKAWDAKHQQEPFPVDLQKVLGWDSWHVLRRLKTCERKGYIGFDDDGRVIANDPPHGRVLQMVCREMDITLSDLTGPSQALRLTRARRAVTTRLMKVGYSLSDVAQVLNRHPSTVCEYTEPGVGVRKKIARRERISREAVQCTA